MNVGFSDSQHVVFSEPSIKMRVKQNVSIVVGESIELH